MEHHLVMVHQQKPRYYHNMDLFKEYSGSAYSLACAECSQMVAVSEVESHTCARLQFDCPMCRVQLASQEDLESHIVNGWCQGMKIFDGLPNTREIQVPKFCVGVAM